MSDRPGEPRNVLLSGSSMNEHTEETCHDLLQAAPASELDVLQISYTETAERIARDWPDVFETRPANGAVISAVGGVPVNGQGANGSSQFKRVDGVQMAAINPNDITGLGMRVSTFFERISGSDNQLVVGFDSLTSLLQYVDVDDCYRFLNMFTGQLRASGAQAHFHLDPMACDDRTLGRLRSVFDEEITVED